MSAPWYSARATLRRNLGRAALLAIVLTIGAGGAMHRTHAQAGVLRAP